MTATFHKAHPPPGSRPGTLAIPAGSPPPAIFVVAYGPEGVEEARVGDPAALAGYLIVVIRRVGWPQREAIRALVRENTPFVPEGVRAYLRDTHDHIAQIMELVDSTHELAIGLSDVYLSQLGQRTNEVMKVLTVMASIFIPLTFIAGIYGMNFEHMPELAQPNAYFFVLGLMIAVAGGMLLYFRHRGWIGSPRGRERSTGAGS